MTWLDLRGTWSKPGWICLVLSTLTSETQSLLISLCATGHRWSVVSCLFTCVTCTLAAHSSTEARAQLYGAQVDPSPRVSDVIVLQMQQLVALLYKTNHRSEPEHQNKPSRLPHTSELHCYQMTDNIKDTKPSWITGHVIVLKMRDFKT